MTELEPKIKDFIDDLYQRKLLWYVVEGFDADMIITNENELEAIEMINDFLQVLPYTSIDEATRLQLVRQMKEIQDYFGTDLAMSKKSISPYYSYREIPFFLKWRRKRRFGNNHFGIAKTIGFYSFSE